MQTETSFHYWNGRDARKTGVPRDHGAAFRDPLRRRAWLQGWEEENENIARRKREARTPEIARENEEAAAWFEEQFQAWKQELQP